MMDYKIFCDESGFTGNHLLDEKQPIFTYASILSTDIDAERIVNRIINKYNIQNGEIKAGNLVKSEKGKRALNEILESLDDRFKICICDKKYSIAGKFFEYIFEPALADKSSIFYGLNFHRFITDNLHLMLVLQENTAESIFNEFYKIVKNGTETSTDNLFHPIYKKGHPVLDHIKVFAYHHKDSFIREMNGYLGQGSGKWLLDLTTTCLFSSLGEWGKEIEVLDVYCDESKPLNANQDIFNIMIGRKEKKIQLDPKFGLEEPITFNLKQKITMANSKDLHGIQLADAVAGIYNFAYQNKDKDQFARQWMMKILNNNSLLVSYLVGNFGFASIKNYEGFLNFCILELLAEKSKNSIGVLSNIEQEIFNLFTNIKVNPPLHLR